LEGTHHALAALGYNRDGKKGTPQMVIGLLCDEDGQPVALAVFPGHTPDPRPVAAQLDQRKGRCGVTAITFVGDHGLRKGQQVADLAQPGFHSITALPKPQLEQLLRTGPWPMALCEQEVAEVLPEEGIRDVRRRHPLRAQDMRDARHAQLATLQAQVATPNHYLPDPPRAQRPGGSADACGSGRQAAHRCLGRPDRRKPRQNLRYLSAEIS